MPRGAAASAALTLRTDEHPEGREFDALYALARIATDAGVADVSGYTDYGRVWLEFLDSVMSAYEPHCDGVFECWTTKQLEVFANAIADLHARV